MERKLGTSLNPPILFCFLLVLLPGTETLEVKVSDSAVKVVKEQDVFIPCTISGYGSTELDLQLLSVHWSRGSDPVYIYDRGSPNPIRTGSELDVRLIKGNAGLYLPQVQMNEEGQYTCTVTYNNEGAEGTSSLEVSVKPSARLVPSDVIIEEGTERGVTCHANNYYPEMIKFQWIKHLNVTQHVVLRQGVSTNEPLENGDGTFNVTSQLMLKPSLGHDGEKYSCIISHRSLGNSLVLDFILSVKEWRSIMIGAVVGTLAAVILVAGICCGYFMFMKKEPPRLSPIMGSELLLHEKKATLSFQISGFRPRDIQITINLKRKGGESAKIYSWNSEVQTGSSAPRDTDGWDVAEMKQLLRNGEMNVPPAQRQLRVEMVNVIRTNKRGISNCQCTIHITPDIEEDDGAELTVKVTHSALRLPISESCRLQVNEETMLLVMDEDYRVRVGPAPRDPTDNFHERAITLGRLDGLENIALSPTGKLFAIREGNLYSGPVSSCTNQILFSPDRRNEHTGWDMFKLISVDPRGLLCAVKHSGTVFRGPHPDNESQNWIGDLGVYVGQYNCSDVDSVFFDPQGSLYAKTSDGQIKMWVKPAETDSDWLDLGTALRQRDDRDSPHVISFCPEGNLWWVSEAEGKLYKGPQPTQHNPGYWGVATFLGQDYNRYRLFGFIGGTFIQRIQKFEFLPELGKIVTEMNIIVNVKTYDNSKGDNTLNDTFSFEETIKETSRFIYDHNIVFMEEVTLSLQEPVVVAIGKAVHMEVSVQKAKISVPYKVRLLTGQGHTITIEGSWEGTTFYNLRATPRKARGGKSYSYCAPKSIWKE
ncbi:hypothetical protein XELAEV_18021692mg [Xenopus laevis]|uniref:Ig-like domain-containing protein n=1 Tax=Xenopus laevis TaxID=8355 RepID=A0A974D0V9_XENLA|nr:hypothetical protein XELAEV_18021692mg [Xenopus laevis]